MSGKARARGGATLNPTLNIESNLKCLKIVNQR
jgi:hypothetical protein